MKQEGSRVAAFKTVRPNRPPMSVFNLSYEKKFTCDMGQLIPVMCDEVVPGDIWEIGNQAVIRFAPMVAPVLHEINCFVHYFFVPNRILWNESANVSWEAFITGGIDGTLTPTLPRWTSPTTTVGSLWDFMGFQTGVTPYASQLPVDFPRRAYNRIFNEYYRDETLYTAVAETNETILNRSWEKDYFTSCLPFQQRGTSPSFPLTGSISTSAVWPAVDTTGGSANALYGITFNKPYNAATKTFLDNNTVTVNLSTASLNANIADLRLAFQIQKWMERNARAGNRYTEFLHSHFSVAPRDERLQRPEYIGGTKAPIIISEVLQTSQSGTTPQGNMAGHGIGISAQFAGKYRVQEFGWIMGLMSVMPKPQYMQGINRQFIKTTKYDYYFPEFAHLSEQAITNAEIYVGGTSADANIFGYQGRYDEMRTKQSLTCSGMRGTTYNVWHLARNFGSLPTLNSTFITCTPDKRIFAATSEPGLIVSFGNVIKAIRPLPIVAEPGLIDHG